MEFLDWLNIHHVTQIQLSEYVDNSEMYQVCCAVTFEISSNRYHSQMFHKSTDQFVQ